MFSGRSWVTGAASRWKRCFTAPLAADPDVGRLAVEWQQGNLPREHAAAALWDLLRSGHAGR